MLAAPFGLTSVDSLSVFLNFDESPLGVPSDKVVQAVRLATGLVLPEGDCIKSTDDYYEVATEQLELLDRSDPSGRSGILMLFYASTYFHEIRHVHDLVSSAYGIEVFFRHLNINQNLPLLLQALEEWQDSNPHDRIPLPLNSEFLDQLPQNLSSIVTHSQKCYGELLSYRAPTSASSGARTIDHLLEVSAVNVQLAYVFDVFGHDAMLRFARVFQRRGRSQLYLDWLLDLIDLLASRGCQENARSLINYIVSVALESPAILVNSPHPVILFEGIFERLLRSNVQCVSECPPLVDSFLEDWGLMSLEEIRQSHSRRVERIAETLENEGAERTARFLGEIKKTREWMNDAANRDLDSAFSPKGYSWYVIAALLPSVPVHVNHEGKSDDFLSRGITTIPPKDWLEVSISASIMRLLLRGRRSTRIRFVEDLCFRFLTQEESGPKLKFKLF